MSPILPLLATCLLAGAAVGEEVTAARTIRVHEVIGPEDLNLVPGARGADALIGKEARITIFAGRPVRPGDLGEVAVVERNQTIMLTIRRGGLTLVAEGRAMSRAAAGDMVRVMNSHSKTLVTGRVAADGSVIVNP